MTDKPKYDALPYISITTQSEQPKLSENAGEVELKRALALLETPRLIRAWLKEQPDRTFESWYGCVGTFLVESGIKGQPIYYSSWPGEIRIHQSQAKGKEVPQWCWSVYRSDTFPHATLKDDKWETKPVTAVDVLFAINQVAPEEIK